MITMSWLHHFPVPKKLAISRATRTIVQLRLLPGVSSPINASPPMSHDACVKCRSRTSNFCTSSRTLQSLSKNGQNSVLSSNKIRRKFLDYFQSHHDHVYVPSSSVIPYGDPTLLFTNAGMNQFKDIFEGTVHPHMVQNCYRRVVNSQKCIRVGGKHNDLDDVGKDHTHHTFFEMLGNWSFGDFFKKEACTMALDLLTNVYGLPRHRLYFTYFEGNEQFNLPVDKETRDIWLELGIPKERVLPFGMKDNFWEMGSIGPCGPCTEIHYDRRGNTNVAHLVNCDHEDVVEIWNLVFMQFYRNEAGKLHQLPKHHVDTGMGLERLVSIMQGVHSNYETDLFRPLLNALEEKCPIRPYQGRIGTEDVDRIDAAYRAVADHARMLTVAIADGCRPDSQRRGYVIKRVLRRAIRYASERLQTPPGTLGSLVPLVVDSLGDTFPELEENPQYIAELLDREEELFSKTLRKGEKYLKKALAEFTSEKVLPGDIAFRMYDAYGFPLDLTTLIANEHGLTVDIEGFERSRLESKEITSQGGVKNQQILSSITLDTNDIGHLQSQTVNLTDDSYKYNYHHQEHGKYVFSPIHAHVLALKTSDGFVDEIASGKECGILLDRTTFYSEQGGQEWDEGCFMSVDDKEMVFSVCDVQSYGGYILHAGMAVENISIGDHVTLYINEERREHLMRNHTGTHILNFALRHVLGQIEQKGSLVAPDRFRFDFNAERQLKDRELQQISSMANEVVSRALPVHRESMALELALAIPGVRTVTGETYPTPVTILSIGGHPALLSTEAEDSPFGLEHSVELCGGTHVESTGHVRKMVIVSEKAVSKGIRRLTVVTKDDVMTADYEANKFYERLGQLETQVHSMMTPNTLVTRDQLVVAMEQLTSDLDTACIDVWKKREVLKQIGALQSRLKKAAKHGKKRLIQEVITRLQQQLRCGKESLNSLVEVVGDGLDNKDLMKVQQALAADFQFLPVMLMSADKDKAYCVCHVPKDIAEKGLHAGQWLDQVMQDIDGKGSGSETFAMGRGKAPKDWDHIVQLSRQYTLTQIGSPPT